MPFFKFIMKYNVALAMSPLCIVNLTTLEIFSFFISDCAQVIMIF